MRITTLFGITSDRKNLHTKKGKGTKLTAGEFLHPFTNEKIPPPMAPIINAPPQSSTIRYGLQRIQGHNSVIIPLKITFVKKSWKSEGQGSIKLPRLSCIFLHLGSCTFLTWLWRNNCNNIISQYSIGQYFSPVTASYRKQEVNNAWWVVLLQPMKIHNNRAPNSCINMAALSKWISLKDFLCIFKVISPICCLLRKREHPQLS